MTTNILEVAANEEWLRAQKSAITLSKLADGSIRPPEPLFDGLLLHETLTMVSGEPYTGKTLFLIATALSLTSGKPLFGIYPPKELRRVLFIGQDAPTWDYAGQALKLARGYGIKPDDLKHYEVDFILNEGVILTDKPFLEWLGQWHEATKFEVLIIDTLLDVHTADENSNSQMRLVMKLLKNIRDTLGTAIIFSHHTSKPSIGDTRSANYMSRGATVIPGSSDFHFQLRAGKDHVDMLWPKGRGASGMDPPTGFQIVESVVGDQPAITLVAPSEDTRTAALAAGLSEGPTTRSVLIAEVLKHEPGLGAQRAAKWVDNQLQAMKKDGTAIQEARGRWKLS